MGDEDSTDGTRNGPVVQIDGDRILAVAGDPDDPVTAGYTCSKGRAGPTFHHHPQRIDVPLVRSGDAMEPTSWDHAIGDIAERLRAIIAESDPNAVASYLGTGGPLDPAGVVSLPHACPTPM